MAEATKDTIYIDVDDDITAIIEKVRASQDKIIALVLPKRASAMQSIVNMKLLKRTAKTEGKKLVLITSEAGILPLAGAVGLHVAKTLQSKPAIPSPPEVPVDDEEPVTATEPEVDKSKTVGELSDSSGSQSKSKQTKDKATPIEDTLDIEDIDEDEKAKKGKKSKKDKKPKIPNFDKFRTRLLLAAGGLVILIVFLVFATKVWPRATVTIKTDAVSVDTNFSFVADTAAESVKEDESIVPAKAKEQTVTNSQKVAATGKKNVGDKATGTIAIYYCPNNDNTQISVPAGTVFAGGGKNFTTNSAVTVPASNFTGGGTCKKDVSKTANVTAIQGGAAYNISATSYIANISGITGSGSNMAGGTDKEVTVVQQSDIDSAVEKLTQDTKEAKEELTKEFKDDKLFPLPATIVAGEQTVTTDKKVGEEASEVTVTATTKFTMLGVQRDDLKKLVEKAAASQIDTKKQSISDDGLEKASFNVTVHDSPNKQTLTVQATALAGAQINADELKKQITGKKRGDVEELVQNLPSVQGITVKFSPFWVNKVPGNAGKVNIVIENTEVKSNDDSSQ